MAATAETVRGNISDASGGGGKENKPEPSDSGRQQSINNDDSQQSKVSKVVSGTQVSSVVEDFRETN